MSPDEPRKSLESSKFNIVKTLNSTIKHLNYEHLIAGVCGGVIATLSLHPLDVIKVKFQGMYTPVFYLTPAKQK